jgi:ADP-ribose pyrophosphatase YjhB (NUDIX family)
LVNYGGVWQAKGMTESSRPYLSVTVSLFTSFDSHSASLPSAAHLSQGSAVTADFGMGLWVVTRKANEDEAYRAAPTGRRVLPSSLVRSEESLADTARRILKEELGIDVSYRLRQNRIFDDLASKSKSRIISINFWAYTHIDALAPLLGGKDQVGIELVSSTEFLDNWAAMTNLEKFDGVSRFGLRFAADKPNAHRKQLTKELWAEEILDDGCDAMVFYGWRDIRYGFTGRFDPFRFIGTQTLPHEFRLTELRELYEVVRGQRIQADQFRRMVTGSSGYIESAGATDLSGTRPGKPASLFRLKDWAIPKTGFQPL